MDDIDDRTTLHPSHLVSRTTLEEFLGHFDRRAARHPDRALGYEAAKAHWRSDIEPVLSEGGELWRWRRPPDDIVSAFGVAVVRDGLVVKWWLQGTTM